ncbi:grasp-with-spasm system ATP-grasp peptide maturase [Chryseobacterium gotjawalense]|uniref:Grasp-with-spasm system ATP-grasp peptide maturase n=1 Tax=Chryseobacterium gotjawalense TaxID=3042315 RepID=A0ABY8REF4_9FLAO|nr:grasp-with-spasm system ATP-grasp peptide maturase [Chryseobacterium sp. wdc7]WHF51914.1 grasp-with-spasm system ATP-grasp peptide maturase [Chryseobacterium sp. wdc7]
MILLISQSEWEFTTDLIHDWINHLGGNVQRLNGLDLLDEKADIHLSNDDFSVELPSLKFEDINIIWFRRWYHSKNMFHNDTSKHKFLVNEFYAMSQYFFSYLDDKNWYNKHSYFHDYICKSQQLIKAKESGFNIPNTLITSNKLELLIFFQRNKSIITKPISDIDSFFDKKESKLVAPFTSRIDEKYLESLPNIFFPSLFQEEIIKKYELRIFFDKGNCYPMAIFSTNNKKTEVDFRQYDNILPNRNVSYSLTKEEEYMIRDFMKRCDLETGSLDFIVSEKNELYFLEVNPLGQFGMVSLPCNYYIEKEIAKKLITLDNEETKSKKKYNA